MTQIKSRRWDLSDSIALRIAWDRLIAIADRADTTLARTAFSEVVRESRDYVCGMLDAAGNGLAQSSQGLPAFTGSLPRAAKHMLERYPVADLGHGDVLITNDPFVATGQLADVTIVTPIFRNGLLVALAGSIAHMPDMGGSGGSPESRETFEEGLRIPILKMRTSGRDNADLMETIRANVRLPDEVLGDMSGQIHANAVMGSELLEFMSDYDLKDLSGLAREIHDRSEAAMRSAIQALPAGTYVGELALDGIGGDVVLRAEISVREDHIHVDFTGSSRELPNATNVVPNYRFAHTAYALKCLLDPDTPNNEGSVRPLSDSAPPGCIVNPAAHAATHARNLVGHAIPSLVFKILAPMVPERVQGDSGGGPIWVFNLNTWGDDGNRRSAIQFLHGGQGGRSRSDGNPTLSFPSNCRTVATERLERAIPILVEEKSLIAGSGGVGQFRGGLGQRVVLRSLSRSDFQVHIKTQHHRNPCEGVLGGGSGRRGRILVDDAPISGIVSTVLRPGGRLVVETPGGGGWGDSRQRAPEDIARDLAEGWIGQEVGDDAHVAQANSAASLQSSSGEAGYGSDG